MSVPMFVEALPDTSRSVRTLVRAERALALVTDNPGIETATLLDHLGITRGQLAQAKRLMDSPYENPGGRTIRYDVGGLYTGAEGWYATADEFKYLFAAHEEHVKAVVGGLVESLHRNRAKAGAWSAFEMTALRERVGHLNQADQGLVLKAMGYSQTQRRALLAEIEPGDGRLTRAQRRAMGRRSGNG